MATYGPYSHSPQVPGRFSPRMHLGHPITPVHSPHHSVTSSASSRTPIHTVTIHEYRKQQNTPVSQTGTPIGKTLRRKAAASALSDTERAPSVTRSPLGSGSSLRALHSSQSEQQLHSNQALIQPPLLLDLAFRSQSAEPRVDGGSISSTSIANSSGKLRQFNTRKRLPRPLAATGPVQFPSTHANTSQLRRSRLPSALSLSTDYLQPSANTTPTPSDFSLSRFPQPPHYANPSLSPPHDENISNYMNTLSFSTTAPATPPATPAIIHYRGASFDLVNPHDSLLLHDIVTPSRDLDSSDFLPLRSSEQPLVVSSEMAPKRALYGDLNSAHASIMRRAEDPFGGSNLDLPSPPTPAAISPNSSSYTSPMYSPESVDAPSPLAIRKAPNDSRFSLKHLTRTLSRKLGKTSVVDPGEELREIRDRNVSFASVSMDGEYPRPLDHSYIASPQASYFPLNANTANFPTSPQDLGEFLPSDHEVELPRNQDTALYDTEALASLIPDDPSTQIGRMGNAPSFLADESAVSKPYYDDLDSIYPSSSMYTGDDQRKSTYQQSLASNRQSNPFLRYSGVVASGFASEYDRASMYGYDSAGRSSRPTSRTPTQELYHHSVDRGDAKTDTISKLIDEYNPNNIVQVSRQDNDKQAANISKSIESLPSPFEDGASLDISAQAKSELSQFEFELQESESHKNDENDQEYLRRAPRDPIRRPTITQNLGPPPREAAPLAPAFEYDEAPFILPRSELSRMFSDDSSYSYGDTQNLLQIPQHDPAASLASVRGLQPSSSYSQPGVQTLEPSSSYSQADGSQSPHTPQEALDQAEKIFEDARMKHHRDQSNIPAMWIRRSSGSQLLTKKNSNRASVDGAGSSNLDPMRGVAATAEQADWETIGRPSRDGRESLDSIADYSSSDGSRDSLGPNSYGSLPSWAKQNHSRGPSCYSHPSPLRSHTHPFSSSPPGLKARASTRTAPESSPPLNPSSPAASKTAPVFRVSTRNENVLGRGVEGEQYAFTPRADPYGLSDKETQELLASGPNDNIIVEDESRSQERNTRANNAYPWPEVSSSPQYAFNSSPGIERVNTFEKLTVVGPKGNLTGTPRGTGMHDAGSSVADNSSPGHQLSSSVSRQSFRSDYTGFYASPFPATGSVTRIDHEQPTGVSEHARSASQETLFPGAYGRDRVNETSPFPGTNRRQSLRYSTTFKNARRTSRAAVPGQTKLREMVLASEGRGTISSQNTNFSKFMNLSGRPSTSDTNRPLRPSHPSIDIYPPTTRTIIAHEHSPHLLCPERQVNAEDEVRRRKLSWIILAAFCLLPPCIILFRVWGDYIMASLTEGRLGHCTLQAKRMALIAGVAVNIGIVTAIVVPIVVLHALKAL